MSVASAAVSISDANATSVASRPGETIPATLVLTALTMVTAVGFCRVFSGWEFLGPMLFVVIGVHVVCALLRVFRVPGYVALPLELIMLFSLVAWKYYPDTMWGPFPSRETWDFVWADLQLARDQFPNAVAPVAPIGGFVVAAVGACGLAALLSDAFAFRAYGRAEATVPTAVLFVFAAALGDDDHRVLLSALWLATALGLIAVLRAAHDEADFTWIGRKSRVMRRVAPLAALLAIGSAVGGAWIGPHLPGAGEKGLIKANKHDDVTEVVSPLVELRSRLVNLGHKELFTVSSTEAHYWRIAGLEKFDGDTWAVAQGTLESVSGQFSPPPALSHNVTQSFEVTALGGKLLPAAYAPIAINRDDTYYVPSSGTLVMPGDGLQPGTQYQLVSAVVDKSSAMLRSSSSDHPENPETRDLPPDFPDSVRQTAYEVTAGAATVYDKAIALQNWFRTNFAYDTTVQKGHSNNALRSFLQNRRGYCEQFSGAFAAMMRSIGIPARVAVGFTSGDLRSDAKYHVFGRNAHAWPEVWFDSVGWVSFEPTPGRGEPGTEQYTGVAAQQAAPVDDPNAVTAVSQPAPAPAPTAPAGGFAPSTTLPADAQGPTSVPSAATETDAVGDGGISLLTLAILAGLVFAGLWIALLPRVLYEVQRRRQPDDPVERIQQSWRRSGRALKLIGLDPKTGETPLEHARRAERHSGIDHRTLRELAMAATAATYGGIGDQHTATRCDNLATDVIDAVKYRLNTAERITARIDPRRAKALVTE